MLSSVCIGWWGLVKVGGKVCLRTQNPPGFMPLRVQVSPPAPPNIKDLESFCTFKILFLSSGSFPISVKMPDLPSASFLWSDHSRICIFYSTIFGILRSCFTLSQGDCPFYGARLLKSVNYFWDDMKDAEKCYVSAQLTPSFQHKKNHAIIPPEDKELL